MDDGEDELKQSWWKIEWMIYSTYGGDCMPFPELVDGCIENRHCKDESPICEVDEKSCWVPEWTRKLYPPWSQRREEVVQVKPGFQMGKGITE